MRRQTPAGQPSAPAGGGREQSVFDRVAELERQLQHAQQAQAKLDHQRRLARARDQRWRERHPDEARAMARARMAAYRARKRQAGSG